MTYHNFVSKAQLIIFIFVKISKTQEKCGKSKEKVQKKSAQNLVEVLWSYFDIIYSLK